MKKLIWVIIGLGLASLFYYWGLQAGKKKVTSQVVQNIELVKEIAELASLEVRGTTKIRVSNAGENAGFWNKFKNYFVENTLSLSIPYVAKYGVDMQNQHVEIDSKKGTVTVYLPEAKLMSLQLKLDEVDAISKTGLLYSATIDEYIKAQKQLYASAHETLKDNTNHIELAENHIRFILEKYYSSMGLKLSLVFGKGGIKN